MVVTEPVRGAARATVRASFWHGRRVLITGHTGFKGSWLSLWLKSLGAEVAGFSPPAAPTEPSLYEVARVGEGMQEITGDVRDDRALVAALDAVGPEVVIHMAAQPLVRRSYAAPRETYATNVMGTVNVLDAVRLDAGPRVVLCVSSDKCYRQVAPGGGWRGHSEEAPLGGHDPYSSSKAAAELVIDAYRSSFFGGSDAPRVAAVRAGNVIGGGDWAAERLLPDLMRAALSGELVRVRNPGAVRPWQHVLNPLSGYLLLAQALWDSPEHAGAWNFGPAADDMWPVARIVDRASELWPQGLRVERCEDADDAQAQAALHEDPCLKLDSAKARAALGWEPPLRLEEGLEATVEWYRELAAGADMRAVTAAQLSLCSPISSA
jgi:CDP-glucose 4,6-dehydratase